MFKRIIVLNFIIQIYFCEKFNNNTSLILTDLNKCKITHTGREYMGTISMTISGVRCQSWYGDNQMHQVDVTIKDIDFTDGDKKQAKNYCRNPTFNDNGPWCYTTEIDLIDEKCDIPLCNFPDCRVSGTGAEYGGHRDFTYSGKVCLSWDKNYILNNSQVEKFSDNKFPDKSRVSAQKFCRNPNDDNGGPWCYTENEDYEIIDKEYCDIPFCDDKDCLVFTRESEHYSTITKINSTMNNMTIWIKLWNPIDMQKSAARLLLSYMPIPTSAKKIGQDWRAGIEIVLSNVGSGLFYPNFEDEISLDYTPRILVGTKWTELSITWAGGSISVSYHGSTKPIFIADYGTNNSYTNSLYPDSFLYYGLMANGPGILWNTEFCQHTCEVHITFGIDFLRLWPIQNENITNEIYFFVRADRNIIVQLYQSPGTTFPCFTLSIGFLDVITLVYQETEQSPKQFIRDVSIPGLLDYFSWKEFHISIFGTYLRLLTPQHYGKAEVLHVHHDLLKSMRWFSIGSDNAIAHWTLFCSPNPSNDVEKFSPPNCISNPADYKYFGTQWITKYHKPCIPWSSDDVPENERYDNHFPDGSALNALNQCRNPTHDVKGPYCYALKIPHRTEIYKRYCDIHLCQSSECRIAGTGNDYIGNLSKTRSGHTCAVWSNDDISKRKNHRNIRLDDTTLKIIHPINPVYLNNTLYPEQNIKNAKNYCRDPSRSIAGPWCYTTNPLIPQDLCNVRDCERNGPGIGRRQYILPEDRTEGLRVDLKSWEPDHPDSITFSIVANDGLRSQYTLRIGAMDNEQIYLFYLAEDGDLKLVMKKTLPHLIYMGMWTNFILRIPRGKVELYYAGSHNPLFEWTHPEPLKAFFPVYYHYTSDYGHTVAVAFDCSSKCTIEVTETDELTRILPVSIRNTDGEFNSQRLVLIMRAKGVVSIPLLLFPETPEYYGVKLGELGGWILFYKNTSPKITILYKERANINYLFNEKTWTNITLIWKNNTIEILINSSSIFQYKHSHPLLIYFFTIIVKNGGKAIWTANCQPTDIDGQPEDGGWSDWSSWSCSASCNGGFGIRKRVCNNPVPNIKGEPCMGPSTMTGRCNTILCGDITEDTIKIIKERMRRVNTALSVNEGNAIKIVSDHDIISRIIHESPDSEINWSHNGMYIDLKNNRISIENYNILINRTEVNDSGVYTMTVNRIDKTHMILKVVSLVVYPIAEIITHRETQSMTLVCNCATLGYLYANLKVLWLINGTVWKNYGITQPISVNIYNIPVINSSHNGLWECLVKQDDLNFHWTTNAIKIIVIGAPNWKIYLMEDEFTRPIFSLMPNENYAGALAIIIVILLILGIIIGTICLIKFKNRLKGGMSKYLIKSTINANDELSGGKSAVDKGVLKKFRKFSHNKIQQDEYRSLIETENEN